MTANDEASSQPSASPSESKPLSTDTPPPSEHASSPLSATLTPNRSELLDRARHFLSSPQVIHQDYESKRRFLTEKGLEDGEIQLLLREMVGPVLTRPEKTQCYVPESIRSSPSCHHGCIPHLLRPVCRAFSWAPSRCFHGWRGAPLLCSLSTTCVRRISSHYPNHPRSTWSASDSCFPALRNRRTPVARSRRTKASFSTG
jgi:hypothetical protein